MSSRARRYCVATVGAILCALVTLTGCDNTVDPFVSSAEDPFAIYGYLDSEADTQFVRISPIIDVSGFAYGDTLDAHVILVNLSTGTTVRMEDSSFALDDERRAYFYYSLTAPTTGSEYRLDVFPSGGDTTHAFTRMPGADQVDVQDPEAGVTNQIVQPVRWMGVSSVRDIQVHYYVRIGSREQTVSLAYGAPRLNEPNVTTVELQRDRDTVLDRIPPGPSANTVELLRIAVSAELLSPEWGLGAGLRRVFFGSIGRVRHEWTLADSTIERIGYRVPAG